MADVDENQANTRGKTWSEEEELSLLHVYFEEEIQLNRLQKDYSISNYTAQSEYK